jgi:hypothetical protein
MSAIRPGRFRGLAVLLAGVLCTAGAAAQDRDGDAIPDAIETQGWYVQAGGSVDRQDVWVECDSMPGAVAKIPLLRRRAEEVFERAPVPGGITLHLVFDERLPFEEQWGDVGTQEGFAATVDRMFTTYQQSFDAAPFTGAEAQTMAPYVHYCAFVESIGGDGVSGFSFGIPGDLFVVALGQYRGQIPRPLLRSGEAGTFLHELGHNLGLTHGGGRPETHNTNKPNFLSVMNYHYQFGFVRVLEAGAERFPYWDFARARSTPFNERRIREQAGIGLPPAAVTADTPRGEELAGLRYCAELELRAFRWNGPVDFDCDGTVEPGTVRFDVSGDGRLNRLGRGQIDWDNLVFGTAGLLRGRGPLFLDPLTELRRPQIERLVRAPATLRLDPGAPPPPR